MISLVFLIMVSILSSGFLFGNKWFQSIARKSNKKFSLLNLLKSWKHFGGVLFLDISIPVEDG